MHLDETQIGPILVATVIEQRFDLRASIDIQATLRKRFDAGSRRLVLDLSGVRFIDSSGLGVLVSLYKMTGPAGFALCGIQESVWPVLKLTRTDKVFRTFATREAAVAALIAD